MGLHTHSTHSPTTHLLTHSHLGFNDLECENINDFGPDAKMDHLESFIKQVIGGPVVVVGASLGGGIGITLSVKSPKLVDKLVLIDAQALIDGDGPKQIPQYLAKFGNLLSHSPTHLLTHSLRHCRVKKLAPSHVRQHLILQRSPLCHARSR